MLCPMVQPLSLPMDHGFFPLPCLGPRYSLVQKYICAMIRNFKHPFFTNCLKGSY